jgi:hypothetical protein
MANVAISGDTSGAVTLTVPAVAGTRTVTFPAATGTAMVTGNMPAFSAYANTNQSYSASTHTKVTFGSVVFDTNSNFASSTFTPTVAGYYQVSAMLSTNATVSRFLTELYKNGSRAYVFADYAVSGVNNAGNSALIYMNGSTDYLEVYVYTVGASQLYGAADSTYFNGTLVRAA